jgi:hypothetical protein
MHGYAEKEAQKELLFHIVLVCYVQGGLAV